MDFADRRPDAGLLRALLEPRIVRPRLLREGDFFDLADFEPARFLPPPDDFLAPEDLRRDDFLPADFRLAADLERDFEPPLFFDADLVLDARLLFFALPPELFLPEDLREVRPVARPTAPAACETTRFADSTFLGLLAAFAVSAPITPPTTAPTGPATLPTTAPAAAPASVLEIGGMSKFSEEEDWLPDDC